MILQLISYNLNVYHLIDEQQNIYWVHPKNAAEPICRLKLFTKIDVEFTILGGVLAFMLDSSKVNKIDHFTIQITKWPENFTQKYCISNLEFLTRFHESLGLSYCIRVLDGVWQVTSLLFQDDTSVYVASVVEQVLNQIYQKGEILDFQPKYWSKILDCWCLSHVDLLGLLEKRDILIDNQFFKQIHL